MELTVSPDYELILGKLSLDLNFAMEFFENTVEVMKNFKLNDHEKNQLMTLDKSRFEYYMENVIMKSCDCDSCCNGGEGSGNCSECYSSCCQ